MLKIILCAAATLLTSAIIILKVKKRKIIKKNILEYVGNTPLIYLKSLSEATSCEIYV
jgi:hypothetical protein